MSENTKPSVWTKEERDSQRSKNRAFIKWHKGNRDIDREQARRAFEAGYYAARTQE